MCTLFRLGIGQVHCNWSCRRWILILTGWRLCWKDPPQTGLQPVSEVPPESSSTPWEKGKKGTEAVLWLVPKFKKMHCIKSSAEDIARRHQQQNQRMKTITNCRGKSPGSPQTVLSPVKMITFFYCFPLHLKYLTTKLKCLKQSFQNLWKSKQAISMKVKAVYLCSTRTLQRWEMQKF